MNSLSDRFTSALFIAFLGAGLLSGELFAQGLPPVPKESAELLLLKHQSLQNNLSAIEQEIQIRESFPADNRRDAICYEIGSFEALSLESNKWVRTQPSIPEDIALYFEAMAHPMVSPQGFCRNLYSYDASKIMARGDIEALKKWGKIMQVHLDKLSDRIIKK